MTSVEEIVEKIREILYRDIDDNLEEYLDLIVGRRIGISSDVYKCGSWSLYRAGVIDINSKAEYEGNRTFAVFSPTEEWEEAAEILKNREKI